MAGCVRAVAQAAAALWLAASGAVAHEAHEPHEAGVQPLLDEGEAALAGGQASSATQLFESAASRLHAADIEASIVRAAMQEGRYKQALAFAAHMAGAHADNAGGVALYAWLLSAGGQRAVADRLIDAARPQLHDAALIDDVQRALQAPIPEPSARLLLPPHRLAPYAKGVHAPAQARVVATGVLVEGGQRALVPAASIAAKSAQAALWVRNGLGQTAAAELERVDEVAGVASLRLRPPIEAAAMPQWAATDPFPGAAAYTMQFRHASTATPAWPWLFQGFLGQPLGDSALRKLGIEVSPAATGGPVWDASGRVVGIASSSNGAPTLVTVSVLRRSGLIGAAADTQPKGPGQRLPSDEIYERGLGLALQIIQGEP